MAMKFKRRLPIPQEIREEMPLPAHLADRKRSFDEAVASVIKGEDPRLLLVMGPCSADREDSVLDYVVRLASLQEEVADKLLFIPRVYTNKPRTKGTGYKGLLHNPDPNCSRASRRSVTCTCAWWRSRACSQPTRCSIQRTIST